MLMETIVTSNKPKSRETEAENLTQNIIIYFSIYSYKSRRKAIKENKLKFKGRLWHDDEKGHLTRDYYS